MYKVNVYPDGSTYVETDLEPTETVKINTYDELWILGQLVDVKNNLGIFPEIIIPNLLDAQADRRFSPDQSSGLKLVLEFLNNMKATFKIFHPHNPEVVESMLDNVEIIDNSEFISDVLWGYGGVDYPELILMSSDAGGFKPLMKLCDKINWKGETYSAAKARKFEDGHSKLTQIVDREDFEGKNVLIIDDICVRGGTFIGLSKLLRERNAGEIYLAVSHITLEILKPEFFEAFDKVFTTNSKYDNYFIPHRDGGIQSEKLVVIEKFKTTKDVQRG